MTCYIISITNWMLLAWMEELKHHSKEMLNISCSKDGNFLASCDRGGEIVVWDLQKKSFKKWKTHRSWVNCVVFNPDGSKLASCSSDSKASRMTHPTPD